MRDGIAVPGEKRIVLGVDEEGGNLDVRNEPFAAATFPIILGAAESVEGSGVPVIERLECFDLVVILIIDLAG